MGAWPYKYINDWLEYVLSKECILGFVNIGIIILTFSNFFETVYKSCLCNYWEDLSKCSFTIVGVNSEVCKKTVKSDPS